MSLDEALGMWAEAAQDMASAGLAMAVSNYYNCVDLANQAAEKAVQAVYVLHHNARATYDHNLRALGELAGAPPEILDDLEALTPYHPSVFLAERTPEAADDEVGGDIAEQLKARARAVLMWARPLVLDAEL